MPKVIINTWVKDANNHRISRGLFSGKSSTRPKTIIQSSTPIRVKQPKMRINNPTFSNYISTTKNTAFYLLNASYTRNPQALLLKPLKEN